MIYKSHLSLLLQAQMLGKGSLPLSWPANACRDAVRPYKPCSVKVHSILQKSVRHLVFPRADAGSMSSASPERTARETHSVTTVDQHLLLPLSFLPGLLPVTQCRPEHDEDELESVKTLTSYIKPNRQRLKAAMGHWGTSPSIGQ
jgi:hypothetical protein